MPPPSTVSKTNCFLFQYSDTKKNSALSAPAGLNKLTCKSLAGAPTAQIEHQMVHQEQLIVHLRQLKVHLSTAEGLLAPVKPRFLGKFSREFDNKSALYEIISMR